MAVSISIDLEGIKAVSGHLNGNQLVVDKCASHAWTGDVQEQSDEFAEALSNLKVQAGFRDVSVDLVLANNVAKSKVIEVPLLTSRQLRKVVGEEMRELVNDSENYVNDYYVIQELTERNTGIVLGAALHKNYLDTLKKAFQKSGMKLNSIDIGQSAMLRLVHKSSVLCQKSFMLANVCKDSMEAALFYNGRFIQNTRTRISNRENLGMIAEMSKQLSSLASYQRTMRLEGKIEAVYLTGLRQEELSFCTNVSNAVGIETCVLADSQCQIHTTVTGFSMNQYLYAAGNMFRK